MFLLFLCSGDRDFVCLKCKKVVVGGLKGFQQHLKRVDHIPPFICGQDGCTYDFLLRPSLYSHIRKHHLAGVQQVIVNPEDNHYQPLHDGVPDISMEETAMDQEEIEDQEESEIEEHQAEIPVDLLDSAEKSVLRLRSVSYMTGVAIQAVQEQCYSLMEDVASHLKSKVLQHLTEIDLSPEVIEKLVKDFSISDPFVKLRTKPQQLKCFKEKYGLLEPEEIFLGLEFDSRFNSTSVQLEPTQVPRSYQYVSIKDSIKCVMSNPYLRNLILSEKASEDGYLRSFLDGELFKTLPPHLQGAVRINLYIDDLEIVQALSARIGVYKVSGVYFGIQNLPTELNALLTNIFVTILAYYKDAKKPEVWKKFLSDMKELETEGCEILVDDEPFFFRVLLVAQIGDGLTAHEMLQISSPSSEVFCRCCYIKRSEMWKDGTAVGAPRTMQRHAQDILGANNAVIRKATGVKGPPLLEGLQFFQPIRNSVFDIFHDMQQGLCKMEVKLALRHYVCIKKYFSEKELNSRLRFFNYGLPDVKNKPSPTITAAYLKDISSGYNLHQTGAQMWCLTRAFGFLFGDLVPKDDQYMQLISFLNQIMFIAFAHAISDPDLDNLEKLIHEHHALFLKIFPGTPEPDSEPGTETTIQPAEQQVDNEECDDPEDVDLIEETEENDENEDNEDFEVFVRPEECFEEYEGAAHVEEDLVGASNPGEADSQSEAVNPREAAGPGSKKNQKKKKKPKIVRFINKHHNLSHYKHYIKLFGPLILYWCMRYEAKHYFFKLVATVCHNFKNPLKTLMEMLQMKVAADKYTQKPRLVMAKRGRHLLHVSDCDHANELYAFGQQPSAKVYQVPKVVFNGIVFCPGLYVTLQNQSTGVHPVFACIKAVYVPFAEDSVWLVTQECRTIGFEDRYCAFHIEILDNVPLVVKEASRIPSYRVLAPWKRYDSQKIYLAPRTIS